MRKIILGLFCFVALTVSGCNLNSFEIFKGEDGKSAYELAVLNGFVGTEEEWLVSLNGADGEDGKDGKNGVDGANGTPGVDGVSVVSIVKTNSVGLVDTYTIYYSNGETSSFVVVNGENGTQGAEGIPGENGHTPMIDISSDGYWIIDNVKTSTTAAGMEGEKGDPGVSILSVQIDANGDIIVVLTNGDVINAGHVKDTDVLTVQFFCGDLLVDTQRVLKGEKAKTPVLEDFVVKHWYIDKEFEYEWYLYGCIVTEDLVLYGDYVGIEKNITFGSEESVVIDEYGFGCTLKDNKEVCVSKGYGGNGLAVLEERGILFNRCKIGLMERITIKISSENFESSKLYFGNNPLSFEYSADLMPGTNDVSLFGCKYFVVQNTSNTEITIYSLDIAYKKDAKLDEQSLPKILLETKDFEPIMSRTSYLDCTVSTDGSENDVANLKGKVKIRGNSTAQKPKKPYRIKLDKKASLFGYAKAKNFVLLADYYDGSNMHNYTALRFANMVNGTSFNANPLHVEVILNGVNVGLYTFCEHIDAKEGRLDIEQDKLWERSFDEINFYIERDLSTATDVTETEGITYFKINMDNFSPSQYVFALKYPEKEDFVEELEDGGTDEHEEEFYSFFESLKEYIENICLKFVSYSNDINEFEHINESVDVISLAEYAITDQFAREGDHNQKSFKMYRTNGGLLKFGPNWDYDFATYGLPISGSYVQNPFSSSITHSTFFSEKWGWSLFNDTVHGKPLFKEIWDNISNENIDTFLIEQQTEMSNISFASLNDCSLWMNNEYYCLFDNTLFLWRFITNQLTYLKNYYNAL